MEPKGTYQAGDTADESATPEKVVPLRPYTKKDNAYADRLIGVVSPSAYYLLDYLIRQTVGFHRESVRYSSKQLATVTHLSQRTIFTAIRELEALRVLAKDAGDMGRTQIRTFRLLDSEAWQLPECDCQTTAKFAVVEKRKRTTAKTTVDEPVTTANFAEDATQTTANFADLIKKEEYKENREKEIETDANASGHGVDTPANVTPSSSEKPIHKPRKERELSPDHQYRVDLIAAVSKVRGCASPNKNAEWGAAGKFFRWNGDTSAPIDDVVTCFTIEQRAPHWDTNTLTLNDLIKPYGAYLRSGQTAFENAIKRKRDAANGEYDKPRTTKPTVPDIPSTIPRLSD